MTLLRSLRAGVLTMALAAVAASAATADDEPSAFLNSALGHEIIGPRQAMAEVQDFTEARIPRMPDVKSAVEWTELANRYRADVFDKVIFRGKAASWRDAGTKVEWLDTIEGGPGYRIKKLRYEAVPGLWIPALLYEPEPLVGKVPVVLNVNGHDPKGKAVDYKQARCINQAKRGMIALNVEWFGMGQLRTDGFRHGLINPIDLCGTSGIALHFLSMKRGIDILLGHEHADPKRVAVTGLSGGGWQTIFISPLDTRVTLTDPVAGYSSFLTRVRHLSDLGDSEQTPSDLATVVDYTHLTAMMAPRPTLLTFNAKDNCCFAAPHALPPLAAAAVPIFSLFGKEENLRFHVNSDPGTHNYLIDNRQALYRMLGDHFFPNDPTYKDDEIPCDAEIKTAEQLQVELPDDNADFHTIALELSKSLPREIDLPEGRDAALSWQATRRNTLRALVHPFDEAVEAHKIGDEEKDGLMASYWTLKVAPSWTVPAVELRKGEPKRTVIVIADKGRKGAGARVQALLDNGHRVVAVDPFYFGESSVAERAYLYALMVATVGERSLGIQAGQVMAIARWLKEQSKGEPVGVVAEGPRTSVIALVAAALEPDAIRGLELHAPLGSLKELIESKKEFTEAPELFCFGLLERFDIPQIAAMVAPRPVSIHEASDRAKTEFATLKDWYATLGADPKAAP